MNHEVMVLQINLLESFEQVLAAVNTLCTHVRQDLLVPAWVSRSPEEPVNKISVRARAVQFYGALWYEDGQDGRETLTCPGIVGASPETMEAALACNAAKDTFKAAVLALKKLHRSDANALMTTLHQRNAEVAIAMKRIGAARLNLKQAYRHIPILESRPAKIGFTWSKQGRTIQRTSVTEARRLLERRSETPQIRLELRRLNELAETEVLARVRSVCPHLRANVVFDSPTGGFERRLMQAPLPILLPLQPAESLPEFVAIPPEPVGSSRLQRSDVRIEGKPFLPSIRVHRYRENYRENTLRQHGNT